MTMIPQSRSRLDRGLRRLAWEDRPERPLRLAHVLFVLWVSGTVAWAFYAAALALEMGWWETQTLRAAMAVFLPPVLGHVLSLWILRVTGNPRF